MAESFERRIERLEDQLDVDNTGPRMVVWFNYGYPCNESNTLPDVFDRPLEQWELYRDVIAKNKILLMINPHTEAAMRGGVEEQVPAIEYNHWTDRQNHRATLDVEVQQYSTPSEKYANFGRENEQNETNLNE